MGSVTEPCTCESFSSHCDDVPSVLRPGAAATDRWDGGAPPHSFHLDLPRRGKAGLGDATRCTGAVAGGQQRPVCLHHHCGWCHRSAHWLLHMLLQQKHHWGHGWQQHLCLCPRYAVNSGFVYVCFYHFILLASLRVEFEKCILFCSDPDVPFVPSPVPFGNHVLSDHEEMEIQCRVSDPSANVTLVNVDTQQPVSSVYDSKRGALGVFTAGTYVCKALINGEEHYSGEYIVHGWTGVCSATLRYKSDLSALCFLHLIPTLTPMLTLLSYLRWCRATCRAHSQADCSAGGRIHRSHLSGPGIWDSGRPLEIPWQTGEGTSLPLQHQKMNSNWCLSFIPSVESEFLVAGKSKYLLSLVPWQTNRASKTVHENKRDQEILYTLTIPQATTKDSGIYSCSITDIISNESQTKQLAIRVFGMKAVFFDLTIKSFRHHSINSYFFT